MQLPLYIVLCVLILLYIYFSMFFSEDLEHFATECDELYILFQQKNLEALLSSVKVSIDCLRKRIVARYVQYYVHVHMYSVHVHVCVHVNVYFTCQLLFYLLCFHVCYSSTIRGIDLPIKLVPCFTADVVLSLPNIVSYSTCTCTFVHVHVQNVGVHVLMYNEMHHK